MPRLQVFITIGNRIYKNRFSLDGFATRHPPLCMADWRKCGGYRLWSLVVRQRSEYGGWSSETCLAQKLFIIGRLRFPYCLSASLFGQILLCPTLQKGDCFCLQLPPIAFLSTCYSLLTLIELLFRFWYNLQSPIGRNRPQWEGIQALSKSHSSQSLILKDSLCAQDDHRHHRV